MCIQKVNSRGPQHKEKYHGNLYCSKYICCTIFHIIATTIATFVLRDVCDVLLRC